MTRKVTNFTIKVYIKGVEDTLKYSTHESFVEDMQFLILIFLNRGAVTSKILKKSQEDFILCIKHLANKYGISTTEDRRRLRSTSLGPNVVTLPRIAACFPILTCSLFNSGYGRCIASKTMYTGKVLEAFFSPMFPSVVSRSVKDGAANLHPQLVLWATLIDNVIHQRDKPTPLDQIWTYYLASFNSSVMIPEERHALCTKFGIVEEDGLSFIKDLSDIRKACKDKIRELRPHERIDEILREMESLK
ncbi:hypothetical protein M0802_013909 [Mischocyttarus mexicanus]|nr:hypothetical protein M0802_013909 [Mischocyttarus mexicanus]